MQAPPVMVNNPPVEAPQVAAQEHVNEPERKHSGSVKHTKKEVVEAKPQPQIEEEKKEMVPQPDLLKQVPDIVDVVGGEENENDFSNDGRKGIVRLSTIKEEVSNPASESLGSIKQGSAQGSHHSSSLNESLQDQKSVKQPDQ